MEPTREINEEGRWQVGGLLILFPSRSWKRKKCHFSYRAEIPTLISMQVTQVRRRVHSVYCSKSPFPLSDNNTYGTIATLTRSHIRRFAVGRLHILITNDGNRSAI